jgi:hypothetical protein
MLDSAVAVLPGIEQQDVAVHASEGEGGLQARGPAADDDDVVHGDLSFVGLHWTTRV